LKGNSVDSEITEAKKIWDFEYKKFTSKTNPDSFVLEICNIGKKHDK
jgi:hypothetical protein